MQSWIFFKQCKGQDDFIHFIQLSQINQHVGASTFKKKEKDFIISSEAARAEHEL